MVCRGQVEAWPRLDLSEREKRGTLREEKVRPASSVGGPQRLPVVAMVMEILVEERKVLKFGFGEFEDNRKVRGEER